MPTERLDRLVSLGSGMSRAEAKKYIRQGSVAVNGEVMRFAQARADYSDEIVLCGEKLVLREHIYIMLNKEIGVVSASSDKRDRTVIDCVPSSLFRRGLFPAGRLDRDTTGFVLITDDGVFAHDILSPSHHVPKTYIATVDGILTDETVSAFSQGLKLGNGEICLSATLEILSRDTAKVIIHQGMYHQVKRMFAACGLHVEALKRTHIGNLPLDETLAPGECREILHKELQKILCNNL